jgi:predicted metal-binding membrane protein
VIANRERRRLPAVAILLVAGAAWGVVVERSPGMPSAPGTMGLGLGAFLVFWTAMMAAMMLPSATWAATAYASLPGRGGPAVRVAGLVAGYLLAWAAVGVVAYAVADAVGRAAAGHGGATERAGAGVLVAAGIYQLTQIKDRCLRRCRSPVGTLIRAAGSGRAGHLRAGLAHGGYCVGCCAGLMSALIALGMMDLRWMTVFAGVVALEKNWTHGRGVATAAAVALVALGAAALIDPGIVPGFHAAPMGGM